MAPQRALRALRTLHWDHEKWEVVIKRFCAPSKLTPFFPEKTRAQNTCSEYGAFDQGLGWAARGHP